MNGRRRHLAAFPTAPHQQLAMMVGCCVPRTGSCCPHGLVPGVSEACPTPGRCCGPAVPALRPSGKAALQRAVFTG